MITCSIVIPTKNEEVLLPRLLEDLAGQSLASREVIVADAGSTDRTREIAVAAGARVVDGSLPGPGRNRGAEVAEGEFIFFLDADVRLSSVHFLRDAVDEMRKKAVDVATCRAAPLSRKPVDRAFFEIYNAFAIATEKIRPHAGGFCIFVRRDVHRALHGFDEGVVFAEDMEYVQRAAKSGYRFAILRSHPVATSVRRLEKDGRLAIALKYIYGEAHMLMKGPFKEMPYTYEMGGGGETDKE